MEFANAQSESRRPCDVIVPDVLMFLHEAGIRVPQDLSLITIGEPDMTRFTLPPMATIGFPSATMCGAVAELLIQRIAGGGPLGRIGSGYPSIWACPE